MMMNSTNITKTPNVSSPHQTEIIEISKPDDESAVLKLEINVNNVVCSYSTKCHLNLRRIALEGMHVEYKKENNMVNMKMRKPYTTASIWSSGKITCAGAKSESDAYIAARRYCRLLQKMQFKVKMSNYRVVNVLATCNVPFNVDIIKIANNFKKECSYEPELHPGATFKLKEFKTTLKLYTTGSITLTSPSVSLIHKSINHIYPILYEHRYISSEEQEKLNNIKKNESLKHTLANQEQQQQQLQQQQQQSSINSTNPVLVKSCSNNNINANNNHNNITNINSSTNQFYDYSQFYSNNHLNHLVHSSSIYSTANLTDPLLNNNLNHYNAFSVINAGNGTHPASYHHSTASSTTSSWGFNSYDNLLIDNVNVDEFLP